MVRMCSRYTTNISLIVEVLPDLGSTVSPTLVCIDEKYIDQKKIEAIKDQARIDIRNQIYDAIVKSEAELQLRKLFHDDKNTMPISPDLVEWFLSNSDEILTKLKAA